MKKTSYIMALCLVAALCCSCEKEIKFRGDYSGEKLVLYSNASTDSDSLSVRIYTSRFFLSKDQSYIGRTLTGAYLTGEVNGQPIRFHELTDKPGYYAAPYKAQPGDELSISAHHEGYSDISSSITVPRPPRAEIKSVSVEPIESSFYKKLIIKVTIHDDEATRDFYNLSMFKIEGGVRFRQALRSSDVVFMETGSSIDDIGDMIEGNTQRETSVGRPIDDGIINGKDYTIELSTLVEYIYDEKLYTEYQDHPWDLPEPDPDWQPDLSKYYLEIDKFAEDLYKYRCSRSDALYASDFNEIFGEPVSIHNNITGGIGCFGAVAPLVLSLPNPS